MQLPSGGWKRNGFAWVLGVCATAAMAPFFIFPLLVVSLTGLYLLLNKATSARRAFWDGWFWGWGFYTTGLYWFCIALLTDPDKFAWMIPFALFGLTGVIALYSGVFGVIWLYLRKQVSCNVDKISAFAGMTNLFLFALFFTLIEYARGHLFTGFPWNLAGYSFAFSDSALQLASLVGVYGLTFFAVLLGVSPALLWQRNISQKSKVIFLCVVWGMLGGGMIWGALRLQEPTEYVEGVKLRLVQANIQQHHKWDPKLQMQGVIKHITLTRSPGIETITHVIWPETAVPYVIHPNSTILKHLGDTLPEGAKLITGALRMEEDGKNTRVYNNLSMIDHKGEIVGSYDKFKLVPFGEFLPFRWLIPDALLTPVGMSDMAAGEGIKTLSWSGLPNLRPLICYEAIFPDLGMAGAQDRPHLLLNVTNDAWFGLSTGPYQHFEMARMRAVEQGIPLVRAANTGISAVVDAKGRIIGMMALGSEGVLDIQLPRSLPQPTIYAQFLNYPLFLLIIIGLCVVFIRIKLKKN